MVAIKNMEMPNKCGNCSLCGSYNGGHNYCKYTGNRIMDFSKRADDCPLVEIEERKVGKILICDKYRLPMYECLGCGKPVMKFWEYCPHCGNNIEERKDESNN